MFVVVVEPAGNQCHPLSGMLINHYLVTFFPSRCE
jgi:hypothetical protein